MADCRHIEILVTPYIDGVLEPAEADRVSLHIGACPPCRARAHAEQAIHALIADRRRTLVDIEPPASLHRRCRLLASSSGAARSWRASLITAWMTPWRGGWPQNLVPIGLAAGLVLGVGGPALYELSAHSTQVMAAELTADHVKCFRVLNPVLGTHHDAISVERDMASSFDWRMHLPEHPEREGLELVGARPCVYPEGKIAHIMYLHRGSPVSLFMLPGTVRSSRLIDVLGHEAAVWSAGNRTFVLVASEPREEMERMTSFVHAELR